MKALAVGVSVLSVALLTPLTSFTAGGARPDTVFFEELTFDEIRDAIAGGTTNVIIAAGGTGDIADGAQLATGTSTGIVTYTADRIARAVGDTFVAPVIAYAPDGAVTLPVDQGYATLLEAAATSAKGSGFRNIFLLGEAASSQASLRSVAEKLDAAWGSDGVRVVYLSDYAVKASVDERIVTTSALAIRVDAAVAQAQALLGRSGTPSNRAARTTAGPRVLPTPNPFVSAGRTWFLEEMTTAEIREAVAAGRTIAIVPTGGTEKNGFHMAMGKHNFHARAGAEAMAKKLGNALVAPVLQYVPEGQATAAAPGVLSCARDCFEPVVAAIARSLKALGFAEVLLVGDNGGNQGPLNNVATLLSKEWEASGARAYALTDFYDKGHEYQDAWFLAQFGWDASIVGSHAGVKDTSQLLYVKPEAVRVDRIADSFTNKQESGISGDPTKATLEFGRVAIEFKANAAIAQYRALKAKAQPGERPAGRGSR